MIVVDMGRVSECSWKRKRKEGEEEQVGHCLNSF